MPPFVTATDAGIPLYFRCISSGAQKRESTHSSASEGPERRLKPPPLDLHITARKPVDPGAVCRRMKFARSFP